MKKNSNISYAFMYITLAIIGLTCSCKNKNAVIETNENKIRKIGVLLVNHGSRSKAWRNELLQLEQNVKAKILSDTSISDVRTAFMEYSEPSIATRLKEFDKENYTDVILIPVFLTVSTHSFDDIPTLIGQKEDPKSIELFKIEKMERYKPNVKVHIAPLLDFTDILKKNILQRYNELSIDPKNEGLVLIAYGDKTYNAEWSTLLVDAAKFVMQNSELNAYSYGWCGHIVNYSSDSTTVAIEQVLKKKKKAIVIPVLVAFDEMFQIKIIGDGIYKISQSKDLVLYKPDAILPDGNVENWVIETSKDIKEKIINDSNLSR